MTEPLTDVRVNVTVRLAPSELARIDSIAGKEDRSRSQVIRRLIWAGLQRKGALDARVSSAESQGVATGRAEVMAALVDAYGFADTADLTDYLSRRGQ